MNNKRLLWVDALKGFGIFCVTFAHLNPNIYLETHIYSFHMCLFFFLSGYFYDNNKPLGEFIKKRAKTVFVPFLVWDLLASLVSYFSGENIKEIVLDFFIFVGDLCWNATIWFLFVLFLSECIFACLLKINNSIYTVFFIMICCLVLWIKYGHIKTHFLINLLPLSIFFYAFGFIFKQLFQKIDKINKLQLISNICIPIFGVISFWVGAKLNTRISYTSAYFGNIYLCIIAAIAGVLFYVLLFMKIENLGKNSILIFLGENSMIIMAFQYWLFRLYDKITYRLFNFSAWHERGTSKAFFLSIFTILLITTLVTIFKSIFKNNKKVLEIAKYFCLR